MTINPIDRGREGISMDLTCVMPTFSMLHGGENEPDDAVSLADARR
jgi:hypothetical protein